MATAIKRDTRGHEVPEDMMPSERSVLQEKGADIPQELLGTGARGGKRFQMHSLDGPKDDMGRPTGPSLGQSLYPRHYNSAAMELARSRGEHVGVVDMQTGRVLVEAKPVGQSGDVKYSQYYQQDGAGRRTAKGKVRGEMETGVQTAAGGTKDRKYWNPEGDETSQKGDSGEREEGDPIKRLAAVLTQALDREPGSFDPGAEAEVG